MRRGAGVLLLLVSTTVLSTASPAAAAPVAVAARAGVGAAVPMHQPVPVWARCSGVRLASIPLLSPADPATVLGKLEVYYDAGYNCAVVRAPQRVGATVRDSAAVVGTYVALQRCAARVEGPLCRDVETAEYRGPYSAYAGPVRLYARNSCIRAEGRILLQPAQTPQDVPSTPVPADPTARPSAAAASSVPTSAAAAVEMPAPGSAAAVGMPATGDVPTSRPDVLGASAVEAYAETRPRAGYCG